MLSHVLLFQTDQTASSHPQEKVILTEYELPSTQFQTWRTWNCETGILDSWNKWSHASRVSEI